MICKNCNNEIADNESFCPFCGHNVHDPAPEKYLKGGEEDAPVCNATTENKPFEDIDLKPDYIRRNTNPDRESKLEKLSEAFLDSGTQIPEISVETAEKLEKTAMILGIISIVLSAIRWISAIGLILAITGFFLISKAINIYKKSPTTMFKRCKAANILCAIGLCLSFGITFYWGLLSVL